MHNLIRHRERHDYSKQRGGKESEESNTREYITVNQ